MKVLLIVLLVLLALLLLPFGAVARYDQEGFRVWVKVLPFRFLVFPRKKKPKKKAKAEETPPEAAEDVPSEEEKPPEGSGDAPSEEGKPPEGSEEKPPEKAEEKPKKKGGALDLVRSALPLIKPALAGVKKRLTIDDLELFVTWRADDPADAAIGYGRANAALGALWAVLDSSFKVKKSRLGCAVDFGDGKSEVYLNAAASLNLWKTLTLVVPLLVKFLRNYTRLKRVRDDNMKKEA